MGEKEITLSIQRTVQIFHRSTCFRDEHFQANGNIPIGSFRRGCLRHMRLGLVIYMTHQQSINE